VQQCSVREDGVLCAKFSPWVPLIFRREQTLLLDGVNLSIYGFHFEPLRQHKHSNWEKFGSSSHAIRLSILKFVVKRLWLQSLRGHTAFKAEHRWFVYWSSPSRPNVHSNHILKHFAISRFWTVFSDLVHYFSCIMVSLLRNAVLPCVQIFNV